MFKPVPQALPIRAAMDDSAPLVGLMQRLKESNARFDTIRPMLPGVLSKNVRPGPLDEEGWSLLAANAAVASKLRHLLPLLEDVLLQAGWPGRPIRVKIQSSR